MVEAFEALCEHLRRMGLNATVESKNRIWLHSVPGIGGSCIIGSVRVANRNARARAQNPPLISFSTEESENEAKWIRPNFIETT